MEKIKVFGAPASPYTHKMISILRYRHIAYKLNVMNGNVVKLSEYRELMNLEWKKVESILNL